MKPGTAEILFLLRHDRAAGSGQHDAFDMDLPDDPIRRLDSVGDVVTFLSERVREIAGLSAASPSPAA